MVVTVRWETVGPRRDETATLALTGIGGKGAEPGSLPAENEGVLLGRRGLK